MSDDTEPLNISQITDSLYIAASPQGVHAPEIIERRVRLIISMLWIRPAEEFSQPPLELLQLRSVDSPLFPIPIGSLTEGVNVALPVIEQGNRVMIYCRKGKHRSVAMTCCVLIGLGYSTAEAMRLVAEKRDVADPDIWYIRRRIEKFAEVWNNKQD